MSMAIIGAGVAVGGAALSYGMAAHQKNQAKRILGGLQYPNEAVPQGAIENQDAARERANLGLPSQQYNQAMQSIQRQQNAALYSTQNLRGGLSTIAKTQLGTSDAQAKLDAQNAQARVMNQNNLQGINNQMASWQNKIWDNNTKQKYITNYNYAMGLLGVGNQNQSNAINSAVAGVGRGAAMYGNHLNGTTNNLGDSVNVYTGGTDIAMRPLGNSAADLPPGY